MLYQRLEAIKSDARYNAQLHFMCDKPCQILYNKLMSIS